GLLDIGLPDTHHAGTVLGNSLGIYQPGMDGKGAGARRQVAAVAAPVHEWLVDGNLAVEVIHVLIGLAALRQDHAFAGAGGSAANAVDARGVGVRTANYSHEQLAAGLAWDLSALRQVLQPEKHALAGAATHVGGRDFHLGYL